MSEKEIDKTIEEVMKEMRASPDYTGLSCSANQDSECSHEEGCSTENPKRLKKGIHCGEKPQCVQNQNSNIKN